MHSKTFTEPVVLFASPPPLEELCAITVTLSSGITFSQIASTWQPQIMKCREIIFTEPDILATPAFDVENCFSVVLQQSLFKTGRLQNRFQKIGLETSKPFRVTPALYQSCLRYTVTAKIAPTWNKAGEWMVQGRDFLTHTGYANAVKMNLTVNSDELFVSLLATSVKFPPLQVIDLDVDQNFLNLLRINQPDTIKDMSLYNCWCHVLPSMKRGRVCSVSRNVPADGPFKSYRDLKRHWKNTYGYRLPDTEDDMMFYQISFRQNGGKLFTYPSVCLRAADMQRIPRIDPKPILIAFIQDLHSKLPSICGHPLKFLPKVRYAIPELYDSGQAKNGAHPNLSNKNPHPSSVPLRNSKDLSHMYVHKPYAPITAQANNQLSPAEGTPCPTAFSQAAPRDDSQPSSVSSQRSTYDASRPGSSMASMLASHVATSQCLYDSVGHPQQPRVIPDQAPTVNTLNGDSYIASQNSSSSSIKIVPVFRPKAFKCSSVSKVAATPRTVPRFKPKPRPASSDCQTSRSDTKQAVVDKPGSYDVCSKHSTSQPIRGTIARKTIPSVYQATECSHIKPNSTPQRPDPKTPIAPVPRLSVSSGSPAYTLQSTSVFNSTDLVQVVTSHDSSQNAEYLKRKASSDEVESSMKKPRAKAQVQDVDVEMMARANQLNKVNSVTLLAWLKMKGVPCKTKDKKSDLVDHVNHIIQLNKTEE
ncbi:uncharacterized protein C18orf63-like [Haliotis rufescens]|uniref:uncharacterized protein C18orf63-like n=1 Tax=Haliotis rufescens TaxID=6454 RepID=UPI00201F6FA0|nr:uncharacterized protein C18orf63-like [Haliotis rufescens]